MTENGSSKPIVGQSKREMPKTSTSGRWLLDAKPQPIAIEPSRTAVLVVDMQNDFVSKGGMLGQAGIDLSTIRHTIAPISEVLSVARAFHVPIVYIKMGFRPDLSDLGEVGSPNRERHLLYGVGQSTKSPHGRDSRILIRDTWNTDIISELAPQPGDMVVYKHRYSAFYQTELDAILKQHRIKYLIVTGCTTSVCVESTVRDAFFRDYCSIVLDDCTAEPIGPAAEGYRLTDGSGKAALPERTNYAATLLLVEMLFGWVSDSNRLKAAFEGSRALADEGLSERAASC